MVEQHVTVAIDANPGSEIRVFRIGVADDILRLLVDANESEFAIPELVGMTGAARSTVWRAVDLLEDIGAVQVRETPQRNYVAIDPERLQKDDPILAIEQPEFHDPVRVFHERVRASLSDSAAVEDLVGTILFGSVARGTADRTSDIDVLVVVRGDRRAARSLVAEVQADLESEPFDGDRYTFQPFVESLETARTAGPDLRDIFEEGITIHGDEGLQQLRREVYAGE